MAAKTKVLFVRVNEEDHARITAHAAAAGQSVAEYMRRKALEGDELAALKADVAALKAQLATYAEMREQYNNLVALLANPRWTLLYFWRAAGSGVWC